MNADLVEAIEFGKKLLAEKNQRKSEKWMQEERVYKAMQAEAWAPWIQALEKELPAWAAEFMPPPPAGSIGYKTRQAIVLQLPVGEMLFTGELIGNGEIRWHEINVRIDDEDCRWQNAGRDFHVALGMLAQMNEYAESLRLQEERNAEELQRQGDVAMAQLEAEATPQAVDPMVQIVALLGRIADAVEDIAAVAVTLDGVLETAAGNMSEVRVWGEEEGGK